MSLFNRVQRWRVKRKKPTDERVALLMRLVFLHGIIILAFFTLTAQLWRLQIVEGSQYQERAEANRLRLYTIPPRRGIIYDRMGRLLVQNEPAFTVAAVVADIPPSAQRELVSKLEKLLQVPAADLDALIQGRRASGHLFTPVALKTELDSETAFILEERHWDLPGITVLVEPRRLYTDENALPHVLGYVARISSKEYADLQERGYDLNDKLGKMGVEVTYERLLRGIPGREQVEVDVTGRKRRVLVSQEATPGHNIVLTIDLELQQEMTRLLSEAMGRSRFAAAVAMDPRNGEILGIVSLPAFDNNLFSGTAKPGAAAALLEDERRPLLNYALGGAYPPGSIFKIVTGTAALQEGIATRDTVIVSRSYITVPNQYNPNILYHFRDWASLGPLRFVRAVAMSSDVYFYYLAGGFEDFRGLGPQRLADYARMYGLDELTNIDLPGETQGNVPDPRWKQAALKEGWLTGDTYNFGIGQGYVLATPIQMVRAVAALANGGEVLQPRVVRETLDTDGQTVHRYEKVVQRRLAISDSHLGLFREGMRQAVANGTATAAQVPGVVVAGKTGTAEFGPPLGDDSRPYETHGWFIGFAPAEDPEIAVVVFLEHGQGAFTAAPTAGKILRYYFSARR